MTRHARLRTKEEPGLPRWMPALEGSLDDPPIVLRQDRLKLSLLCLGLTVVGGLMSRPRRFTVVVGEFTHEGPPKPAWRRYLTGSLELGSFWELPAQRVADVLNEARARWAPAV